MCVERISDDETPMRARLGDETGITKLFQIELGCAATVRHIASNRYITMEGKLSTWLQALDRTTAECIYEANQRASYRPPVIDAMFPRRVRLVSSDEYSANFRAERAHAQRILGWVPLIVTCQVHKNAAVATRTNKLAEYDVSGLLNAMLCLNQTGHMTDFKSHLKAVVLERLRISYAAPALDRDARAHRESVFVSFCSLGDRTWKCRWKRHVVNTLAKGDLRDTKVIWHHEVGCCKDPEETARKFSTYFVKALASDLRVFSRSRWTGTD